MFRTEGISTSGAKGDTAAYQHRIKPDDRIAVHFLNVKDLDKLNLSGSAEGSSSPGREGFLVGQDGSVILPMVGQVNLAGLTRMEAAQRLEKLYANFIKNPIIDVVIISLSVSVLGEVKLPGSYPLVKENTTLVEVIAMAGGVSDHGKVSTIKIIRGDLRNPEIIYVDLTRVSGLQSEKLIMRDKDIVFIEPTRSKLNGTPAASYMPYFTILTSLATLILAISAISK